MLYLSHHRSSVVLLDAGICTFHGLKDNPSQPKVFMCQRMIVDNRFIVFAALPDEIFQEVHVDVIVQVCNRYLNRRRFSNVVDVYLEPNKKIKIKKIVI